MVGRHWLINYTHYNDYCQSLGQTTYVMQWGHSHVWKVGGKYIVSAVCLLIVAAVMKLTGISLADIIGMTGK